MALAYIVYQIAGFLWGFHVRDFWVICTLFWPFQVAYFFIFGKGLVTLEEYWIFLPVTFLLQVLVANALHLVFNGPFLLSPYYFANLFYYVKIVFQLALMHAVLLLWWIPEPWGGFAMCILYTIAILLIYWFNKCEAVYMKPVAVFGASAGCECCIQHLEFHTDECSYGQAARVIHWQWWVLFVPAIFFYALISYLAPSFWPFWFELGLVLIQAIYLFLMHVVLPKKLVIRATAAARVPIDCQPVTVCNTAAIGKKYAHE